MFAITLKGAWTISDKIKEIHDYTHRNLNYIGLLAVRKAKHKAPVGVSGHMRAKITHEIVHDGIFPMDWRLRVYVPVFTARGFNYALAVEKGTKPHMPPVSALELWAKRKGVDPWEIAMHIKRYGTKAQPFLRPAVVEAVKEHIWR